MIRKNQIQRLMTLVNDNSLITNEDEAKAWDLEPMLTREDSDQIRLQSKTDRRYITHRYNTHQIVVG
jgi:hypothetical protein